MLKDARDDDMIYDDPIADEMDLEDGESMSDRNTSFGERLDAEDDSLGDGTEELSSVESEADAKDESLIDKAKYKFRDWTGDKG